MKLLFLDIESSPNLATVWNIWNQNISINQLLDTGRIICYAAKWYGQRKIIFDSEHQSSHDDMIVGLHNLLEEADAVCHYNGNRFDIKMINREFLLYGLDPPAPYHNIDLLTVVKKRFKFVSNKLDHVAQELGIGSKVKHEGHELWLKCMSGEPDAWDRMKKYNSQDTELLEKLYDKLLPWIQNHPNRGLYTQSEVTVCPNCGSSHIIRKGIETTKQGAYQRYKCNSCGVPLRGKSSILPIDKRRALLSQSKL